jgi:hypothetical protein
MRKSSRFLAAVVITLGFAWFFWGMVKFPDGPIRPCGVAYCGKQSQPHTQIDFDRFRAWETGLMFGWPFVLASFGWLARTRR